MLMFIAIVDIKPGKDEVSYETLENLKGDGAVTPLLIGRTFEDADVVLLLHTAEMEALDDYLIKNVREKVETEELTVVPIYEFTLLPAFDSIVELESETHEGGEESGDGPSADDPDLLLFMTNIDITPGWDEKVNKAIVTETPEVQDSIPLMTGHAFHSREFDSVLFYLSKDLDSAWKFTKKVREIPGVRDTQTSLFSHFEALVPLDEFKRLAPRK